MINFNGYSENVDLAKAISLWEHIYSLSSTSTSLVSHQSLYFLFRNLETLKCA